ncbi:hypothetical protein ACFFHH_24785 [Cytobacillus solani]|uniref:DUF4129 domain-containing protein n=1 Tax=Cytobacillus solani TaxID=1637975 RepID=A0A0Q3SHC8_9BACI|nr:hypothetical protein [Cytobacillus solani]KOP81888.1 hypothetical protein AMS60_04960 [Bacillus sp. FJAT-21945]KQL18900.1 hypothetical protein AN957_10170 [Cytobacillus solani]USK56818.1 hypothetical protein LIS82_10245 [Cytobacillus solani]
MIKSIWNVMYLLIIEIIFGALVFFALNALDGNKVSLLFYFIIMITSCLVFLFLLEMFKERGKLLFFVLLLPAMLIVWHSLGVPIFFSLLISFLVFWRTISHVNEQDKQNQGKWLLFSILLGVFILFMGGASSPANIAAIGGLMITQVLFIIIGGFLRRWLDVDTKIKNKKQFFLPFLSIILFIGTAGLLITVGRNVFKALFFSVLNLGVYIITFIAKPFFNWAESQDWSKKIAELIDSEEQEASEETPIELDELGQNAFLDPTVIATILFIAILLFFFFYIYKRNRKKINEGDMGPVAGFFTESSFMKDRTGIFQNRKRIPPTDSIRKEIFALERFAKKLNLGRQSYESLSEWMNRVGMLDTSDIISVYEKVRYGGFHYTKQEETHFLKRIEEKKRELKEIRKTSKKPI